MKYDRGIGFLVILQYILKDAIIIMIINVSLIMDIVHDALIKTLGVIHYSYVLYTQSFFFFFTAFALH